MGSCACLPLVSRGYPIGSHGRRKCDVGKALRERLQGEGEDSSEALSSGWLPRGAHCQQSLRLQTLQSTCVFEAPLRGHTHLRNQLQFQWTGAVTPRLVDRCCCRCEEESWNSWGCNCKSGCC